MAATPLFWIAALAGLAACGPTPPAGPVASPPRVTIYRCEDGRTVTAGYPDRDTAELTVGPHSYTLKIARSADGARYTGFGLQWWTKGMSDGRLAPLQPGEDVASAAGVACHANPAS